MRRMYLARLSGADQSRLFVRAGTQLRPQIMLEIGDG